MAQIPVYIGHRGSMQLGAVDKSEDVSNRKSNFGKRGEKVATKVTTTRQARMSRLFMTSEARERIASLLRLLRKFATPLRPLRPSVASGRGRAVGGIAALRGGRPKGHFHLRLRLCGPRGHTSMTSAVRGKRRNKLSFLLESMIFKNCRQGGETVRG